MQPKAHDIYFDTDYLDLYLELKFSKYIFLQIDENITINLLNFIKMLDSVLMHVLLIKYKLTIHFTFAST